MQRSAKWLWAFWSVLAVGMFVGAGVLFATPAAAGSAKVVICHIPPDDPGNAHTITVSEKAVQAHLKHGDWIGECASGCLADTDCDDENFCTDDQCLPDGECANVAVDCDDGNVCTEDLCIATDGCVYPPVSETTACSDDNVCTNEDACQDGMCVGTDVLGCCLEASECNDADLCTDDSCVGNVCVNENLDCSLSDECWVGFCDPLDGMCGSTPLSCDDADVCTDDFCDSGTGCYSEPTSNPPEPVEASCDDGVDNDCDGLADSEDGDCCVPTISEICDGIDNDCDGLVDEDFDLGTACTSGVGVCEEMGTTVCSADGTATECSAVIGTPTDEICDGQDNDCDGTVDETPAVGYTYSYTNFPLRDETPLGCAETFVVEDTGIVCGAELGHATLTCERDPDGLLHATYSRTGCAGTVEGDVSVDVEASLGCAVLDSSTAPGVNFIFFQSFQCCDLPPRSCAVDNGRCGDPRVFECTPDEVTEVSCQLITPYMSGEYLAGAQLYGTDLSYVDLSFADLTGADLYKADLALANLIEADLSGADLAWTLLTGANLSGALLGGANMAYTDFTGADLSGVWLHGEFMQYCTFNEADLSGANLSSAWVAGSFFMNANLGGADLRNVALASAIWQDATYNGDTQFDPGVDPGQYGMIFVP